MGATVRQVPPAPCTLPMTQPLLSPQESETLSVSGMESFIEKQAKLLEGQPADAPGRDSEQPAEGCVGGRVSDATSPAQGLSSSDPGEGQWGAYLCPLAYDCWASLSGARAQNGTVPGLSGSEELGA